MTRAKGAVIAALWAVCKAQRFSFDHHHLESTFCPRYYISESRPFVYVFGRNNERVIFCKGIAVAFSRESIIEGSLERPLSFVSSEVVEPAPRAD